MVNVASLFAAAAIAAVALAPSANGHAQQLTEAQIAQRRLLASSAKHALGDCAQSESYRKLQERAVQRRQAAMNRARRERRLALDDFLAINHESSLDVTASTDSSVLFGDEVSCILQPEVTYGPYYIKGEHIRTDVRETQVGIDFYFDLQVIDVDTCEPVENMYMDFWHANASGVYAGVVADGNGAGTDDPSNVNATFLRGVYPTDSDGVVQFISKFPGHYVERATHIHLLANYGGTVLENGTYSGGYIPHVAQFFFDQDLLTSVYATSAYENDTAEITLNEDDMWLQTASVDDFDSLVEYALLGDSVEDGIFGWISVAMNMSASQTVSPAGYLTASGGVLSSTSTTTGGGGSGMGGGSMGGFGGSMGGFGGSFAGGSFAGGSFAGGDAPAAGVSGSTDSETTGTVTTSSVAGEASTAVSCSL